MPKDVCTVELPETGTAQVINLVPNQVNTLSFPKDCVLGDPKLNADGSVSMDLINGSSVVIANFQEIADMPQDGERETIIQLSDNTIMNPKELYAQLASVDGDVSADDFAAMAPAAGEDTSSFGVTTLNAPVDGSIELAVQAGQEYQFGFDLSDVQSMIQRGSDLVLTFADGGNLTLTDFYTVASGALPPVMTMADGSVVEASSLLPTFLASREVPQTIEISSLDADGAIAETAAGVEPAAGEDAPQESALEVAEATIIEAAPAEEALEASNTSEEPAQTVESTNTSAPVDLASVAEKLASIEPAAGETATADGSRGGFGFQSGVDAAPLVNDPAVGPHQYTELQYDAPEFVDEPFAQRAPSAPVPPTTPEISIPSLVVKEDSSVDVVIDVATTGGNDTLTVEIDVPVGWSVVDLNGGTYDAGTGIWTFTTVAGADFLGGPEVAPPADSDIDSEVLDVRVTATDTGTGLTAVSTETYTILTDAVADVPTLAATGGAGEEGTIVPLTITTATTDVDGSEVISLVRVTGVPVTLSLTAGTEVAPGVWELDVADLPGLGVNAPDGTVGTYTFTVEVIADEDPVSDNEFDFTDNQATNTTDVTITITPDDIPKPEDDTKTLDESDLPGPGPLTVGGTVTVDYGTDGPGIVTPKGASTFTVNGSVAGGTLSSNGSAITITLAGNTYTGTAADGRDIFTMTVNANGSYSFTLLETLDHEDGTNPNDVINLHFCYQAEDNEGDTENGLITIKVADDAPVAADDANSLSDTDTVKTGDVLTNDDLGEDTPTVVTEVEFNGVTVAVPAVGTVTVVGDYGNLALASDGSYTYTRTNDAAGNDVFTYTIVDFDGDPSKADLTITLADADDRPEIDPEITKVDESGPLSVSGTFDVDFLTDGPGTITPRDASEFLAGGSLAGGNLTSNGSPVAVTLVGDTYTGTSADGRDVFTLDVNTDGTYTFTLIDQLDHADVTDPDDVITLQFGVDATDADADVTSSIITIAVNDDGPVADNDTNTVADTVNSVNGNVITNDEVGFDEDGTVVNVNFNGVDYAVPAVGTVTVTGNFGTLQLAADGTYTYTRAGDVNGQDVFTYTLRDADGDTDPATLTINVEDIDIKPEVGDADKTVDETDLGPLAVSGTIAANFGTDGPGTITPTGAGSFSATGSVAGGALTSGGVPVTVTLAGDTYTGTAGTETIFTLVVDANGAFTFNLIGVLDHADITDHDDVIDLAFGVTGTDADGDTDTGTITVHVKDDGPYINTKFKPIDESNFDPATEISYTHTLDFDFGEDGAGTIEPTGDFKALFQVGGAAQPLLSGGELVTVSSTATGYVGVAAGGDTVFDLVINPTTGQYTYTQYQAIDHPDATDHDDVIWLKFEVQITDADGDTDTAIIGVDLHDDGPKAHDDDMALANTDLSVTGNVLDNDDIGADVEGSVVSIRFNGVDTPVPTVGTLTVIGDNGTLEIAADGTYTYTRGSVDAGQDVFGYTMQDFDGDTSFACLTFDLDASATPVLIVGKNVDDVDPSATEYEVGIGEGTIIGDAAGDILIGDVGGASLVDQEQDHNVVMVLDVSGSMGSPTDAASRISLLVGAVKNLMTDLNTYDGGQVKVHFVTFAKTVQGEATSTISNDAELTAALA
ncbi:MAG: cadherin-like domain-containing protein, partial [Alphaproteobacteria bacterium]|nr:cadherin-like domain-containing protein [Alphaproteobacteria bacterium]